MLRKWFLVPVLGSLALLLLADAAQAQLLARRAIVRERRMERRDERRGIVQTQTQMQTQPIVTEAPSMQGAAGRLSYYPTPANLGLANAAQIRVLLPNADAKVIIDGNQTMQKGTDRWFYTPPLTTGAANNYQVRITYMQGENPVTLDRTVQLVPGRTYQLDFTQRN